MPASGTFLRFRRPHDIFFRKQPARYPRSRSFLRKPRRASSCSRAAPPAIGTPNFAACTMAFCSACAVRTQCTVWLPSSWMVVFKLMSHFVAMRKSFGRSRIASHQNLLVSRDNATHPPAVAGRPFRNRPHNLHEIFIPRRADVFFFGHIVFYFFLLRRNAGMSHASSSLSLFSLSSFWHLFLVVTQHEMLLLNRRRKKAANLLFLRLFPRRSVAGSRHLSIRPAEKRMFS